MVKAEEMARLRSESLALWTSVCDAESVLVWGDGSLDSALAIVGEAPGADEERLGRPFVGKAGRFLGDELRRLGIAREEIYITNVLKCRPVRKNAGRRTNRSPTTSEARTWSVILLREIEIVAPKAVLCLGAVAASSFIHPNFALSREHGLWFDGPRGTRAIATYHPAYLLRRAYGNSEAIGLFRRDLASAVAAAFTGGRVA